MTLLFWIAVAVIFVTIWALIKRWETRLVLIAAGLFLCIISLNPMMGLNQFAKSMTNNSLIMAICGSMGFAFTAPTLSATGRWCTIWPLRFAALAFSWCLSRR